MVTIDKDLSKICERDVYLLDKLTDEYKENSNYRIKKEEAYKASCMEDICYMLLVEHGSKKILFGMTPFERRFIGYEVTEEQLIKTDERQNLKDLYEEIEYEIY